ncbi:retrotransposon protein [Cucumis melo var. makuwa]|uniref:Retrotransposon protein n=1 Tax=Cucumis melo var. makuwa TaxID=1194695 RepID=A0A5D3C7D9_CUCMM|nr:retrotransposon protein [Cucumis melo var. makuwa]TYK07833.1 retrotransposon protein [Cucumis melo var. makuwa]
MINVQSVYFNLQNCFGALDGTYIKVNVPTVDRPTFKTRSAADSWILRDALARENGLQVLNGYYYLCDAGYPNVEGFRGPYRGQQYHLQEWRGSGNASTNAKEYFNIKHSSTRNVIERAFNVLKGR